MPSMLLPSRPTSFWLPRTASSCAFPISEIPFKKRRRVGVRRQELAEGDLLSDIYWLEGDNSTEVEFHDRVVHINRLRIGTRDGKGTRQK